MKRLQYINLFAKKEICAKANKSPSCDEECFGQDSFDWGIGKVLVSSQVSNYTFRRIKTTVQLCIDRAFGWLSTSHELGSTGLPLAHLLQNQESYLFAIPIFLCSKQGFSTMP